jgi:hypothetical protein
MTQVPFAQWALVTNGSELQSTHEVPHAAASVIWSTHAPPQIA